MPANAFSTIQTVGHSAPRILKRNASVVSQHPMLDAFAGIGCGHLLLRTPEGLMRKYQGRYAGVDAQLRLHSWKALDALLGRGGLGFSESYMDGQWDTDDLTKLYIFALSNTQALERYFYGRPLQAIWTRFKYSWLSSDNNMRASRRNVMAHYDLGNDFYRLWLDESMTYSCGLFGGNRDLSLREAQEAKYYRILNKLNARPGDHILEIGCGWGGFMEVAAREGIHVTGITLSLEQGSYAAHRLAAAGLKHLATVALKDYREVTEQYDHIVSIGMFEHVGEKYWPTFFETIKTCLKPGGKAMVQTITINDAIFEKTRGQETFISAYIFPGGLLPSRARFTAAAAQTGLVCREMFTFGQDYALTLTHWLKNFDAHIAEVKALGHDDAFIRMWRTYLASCIAAFTVERTSVMQAELTHNPGVRSVQS